LLSGFLKQVRDCKQALLSGLRAITTPECFEYFARVVQDQRAVPSATTLYVHRLTVHLGWCVMKQAQHSKLLQDASGVVVYMTVDSSPQAGRDWLQSSMTVLPVSSLLEAFDLAVALCVPPPGQQQQDELSIMADLERMLRWEPGVPVAIGSGRASAAHKLHALIHSLRLVSASWQDIAQLLRSIRSWTGDMGTESGFARLRTFSILDLFPWACDQTLSGEQEGPMDDLEKATFDFQAEDFLPEVAADQGPHMQDTAQPARDPLQASLFGSLFVPGLLHIIHNATDGLADALIGWNDFVASLRHVCLLLKRP
jgi:hypothetical protein